VDTFPFTTCLASRAITRDKPREESTDPSKKIDNSSREPKGQKLVYSARVSLDRTQMQIEDNLMNLSPGMAVTVEIKTGSRRIIPTYCPRSSDTNRKFSEKDDWSRELIAVPT
jgi:exonuclease III